MINISATLNKFSDRGPYLYIKHNRLVIGDPYRASKWSYYAMGRVVDWVASKFLHSPFLFEGTRKAPLQSLVKIFSESPVSGCVEQSKKQVLSIMKKHLLKIELGEVGINDPEQIKFFSMALDNGHPLERIVELIKFIPNNHCESPICIDACDLTECSPDDIDIIFQGRMEALLGAMQLLES